MASPPAHHLTQSGHEPGKSNAPCCWCKDDAGVFCSGQCEHEWHMAERRGLLPWGGKVDKHGAAELLLVFWERQRTDLKARKQEALTFMLGAQYVAWMQLSGIENYEAARGALLRLWEVKFGERPLLLRNPCPKCGRADPADFWHNRDYCKHCEGEWKAQQQARRRAT